MRPSLVSLLACLCLWGCSREAQQQEAELYVFGTLVSLTAAQTDKSTAQRAFAEIGSEFQRMHRDWHAWEPGALTRLNTALAAGETVTAQADLLDLVIKSRELESASNGRFNAAVGRLVGLWGFHTSQYPVIGPPPAKADIENLINSSPSSLDIVIDKDQLSCPNPAVQLDFGGIAKGAAVDEAIGILRDHGIPAAIVNAGGDLRAYGSADGKSWKIAVQAPGGGVVGGIEVVADEAVFTSGNYQRFRLDAEHRYAHILDPATGWPVQGVSSATVIAAEGWRADAAATALVVAGSQAFAQTVRDLEIKAALLIDDNNVLHMTAAMADRLSFEDAAVWQIKEYPDRER